MRVKAFVVKDKDGRVLAEATVTAKDVDRAIDIVARADGWPFGCSAHQLDPLRLLYQLKGRPSGEEYTAVEFHPPQPDTLNEEVEA